jgi:hypothetical protein
MTSRCIVKRQPIHYFRFATVLAREAVTVHTNSHQRTPQAVDEYPRISFMGRSQLVIGTISLY